MTKNDLLTMLGALGAVLIVFFMLFAVAGCSVQADPSTANGKKMVSNCAVCRVVWTAAGWKTECPAPATSPNISPMPPMPRMPK